jgi:hypothetical protein
VGAVGRVDIAVRSPIRFQAWPEGFVPPASELGKAERQTPIEFDGRTFVWHLPERIADGREPGPSVTVVYDEGDEANGREGMQRFLSALAFVTDERIETPSWSLGTPESDAMAPAISRQPKDYEVGMLFPAPKRLIVAKDARLRLALGLYREALNVGTPFYRFLAYWNVVDAIHGGDRAKVNAFLRKEAPPLAKNPARPLVANDVVDYLRRQVRDALAHIVPDDPAKVPIDPDLPVQRDRTHQDTRLMKDLARTAILNEWPDAVTVEPR